jgi:hypothetical protein
VLYAFFNLPELRVFLSVILGGLITWLVANIYYRKAAVQLAVESTRQRKLSGMILRWLETEGKNIENLRDDKGEVFGQARTQEIVDGIQVWSTPSHGELYTPGKDD